MRILNVRLLVETLIVAAILAPAIYVWYSWQVKRTAAAMLERAGKLTEDKDDRAAAQYYFQYLKLRPDDAGVQVLLAESFDRACSRVPRMRGTWYALLFLGGTIGYGMYLGGQYTVFLDSVTSAAGFGIESIEINGLIEANSEEIADRIDVGLHSSLLMLNAERARSRIAEIPWVADVEVKKISSPRAQNGYQSSAV